MKKCCYDLNQYDITPTSPSPLRYIPHPSMLPADIQSPKIYNAAKIPLTHLITDPTMIPASSSQDRALPSYPPSSLTAPGALLLLLPVRPY